MTQEVKTLIGIAVVTVAILVVGVFFLIKSGGTVSQSDNSTKVVDENILIHTDSNKEGTDSAKVKVVEFGDYQCPACDQAYPITKKITEDYAGKIEFIFRNFPLPQHQYSQLAAEVAESAGAQGKYWEMHDKLYETQNDWANSTNPMDDFVSYAQGLGLNIDQFKQDVNSNKYSSKIQQGIADGNQAGVQVTPTFYINGHQYNGVLTYDEFKSAIDSQLNSQ